MSQSSGVGELPAGGAGGQLTVTAILVDVVQRLTLVEARLKSLHKRVDKLEAKKVHVRELNEMA